jgi:hypothetical protein
MMRNYVPDYSDVGISRERYHELLHYARQYPEWVNAASACLGASAQKYSSDSRPAGTTSDPTYQAVARREHYVSKMQTVEAAAKEAGGEAWYATLIINICYGKPLCQINPGIMPTSFRNAYFPIRRKFFIALDRLKI